MASTDTQEKWLHSVEVSADEVWKTGCFTTLPIRIHRRNEIADEATPQSIRDWHQHVGDGWESRSGSAMSPVGNWCAFIFPESLEERLHSITYLANIGNIHDGTCFSSRCLDAAEDLTLENALEGHKHFSDALDETLGSLSTKEAKTIKMRQLVSQCVLQILALDRDMGMRMIESYRKKWLDVMEHENYDAMQSLDQYLAFRMLNGGMDWEREYNAWATNRSRIVNSIEVLSRHQGIDFNEAREAVRKMIGDYEAEYVRRKDAYIRDHPSTSAALRSFVEVFGLVVAGNHCWCANCPRHHAWKKEGVVSDEPKTQDMDITSPPVDVGATVDSPSATSLTPDVTESSSTLDSGSATSDSDDPLQPTRPSKKKKYDDAATSSDMHLLTRNHPVDSPCRYISSLPSKGVRTTFIDALNQWFMVKTETLNVVKDVNKTLHNASLILDDVQDASPLRRGRPATHAVFGVAQSVNSTTYLFVQAVAAVHAHFDASTHAVFLDILQRMHVGQGYDLQWKLHAACPSEREHLEMVDGKTGAMFELIVALMASKSSKAFPSAAKKLHSKEEEGGEEGRLPFHRLTRLFGRFFQVRDDFMNLNSELYAQGKGFCEDLDEEKLSFLLVTCANKDPDAFRQIMGIFRARGAVGSSASAPSLTREAKSYILSLLDESGVMEATRAWLVDLESQVETEISGLEDRYGTQNSMLRALLLTLSVKDSKK
ncbi:hypothetical protein PG994_001367 [Apiospora phragmitis]|uniref:Geranylgeranyl pyrophosphate synthase n=1 Tax=Apiospora phragmitis TaxID=2905665 RepID=A0ABR1WTB9_9PEZI